MKKLIIFLSTVVLATSMNLIAAPAQPIPMDVGAAACAGPNFGSLPWPAKRLIAGYLSNNPMFVYKISQLCHGFYDESTAFRQLVRDTEPALDLTQLDPHILNDYNTVIARYKVLCDAREQYFNFRQAEFIALQDFMMNAIAIEFHNPVDQINFNDYIFGPLNLNIDFQNVVRSTDRKTPLFLSAACGFLHVVDALLTKGSNVNHTSTALGASSLYIASQNGRLAVVQRLLAAGADVNQELGSPSEGSSLFVAVSKGHLPVIQTLLVAGSGANKDKTYGGKTPLYIAAELGDRAIVQALLDAGADIEKPYLTSGGHGKVLFENTPLYVASVKGHESVVEILLLYGADIKPGYPLMAKFNNQPAVAYLLETEISRRAAVERSGAYGEPLRKRRRKS